MAVMILNTVSILVDINVSWLIENILFYDDSLDGANSFAKDFVKIIQMF